MSAVGYVDGRLNAHGGARRRLVRALASLYRRGRALGEKVHEWYAPRAMVV